MNKLYTITLSAMLLAAPAAWAHGDKEHAKPRAFDASKVEATDFG